MAYPSQERVCMVSDSLKAKTGYYLDKVYTSGSRLCFLLKEYEWTLDRKNTHYLSTQTQHYLDPLPAIPINFIFSSLNWIKLNFNPKHYSR